MINQVVLVGRLTKDPQLSYTPQGTAVANFTMAMTKVFKDGQGNKQEKTAFINCVVWRKDAEDLTNFKKKGELIGVTGELQSRSYDDQQTGKKIFVTEVVADNIQYMPSGGSSHGSNQSGNQGNYQNQNQSNNYNQQRNNNQGYSNQQQPQNDPFANSGRPIDISDDDLPF